MGESLNVANRFRQHLFSREKGQLKSARVVLDLIFNESVCLNLKALLIQRLSGDGLYQVTNRTVGITDRDYFRREDYQKLFIDIFEELRKDGFFTRPVDLSLVLLRGLALGGTSLGVERFALKSATSVTPAGGPGRSRTSRDRGTRHCAA
ncbi:hypothetical protein [Nocardioides pantholopis]|uniref:hypothetical protein n=1 Tax=Nocardioides pantholopis TaxID=2483798 RepID=UPI000FDC8310|nr:hypothetical protein [Nocardioides pantholopis]